MKRARAILASLTLINPFIQIHSSPIRSLHFQVILLSSLSPSFSVSSLPNHQKVYFSSKPNHIVHLIQIKEWSHDLEHELKKLSHPTLLTHETVLYVLKNLDKTPQKALDFFNWVTCKNGVKPSSMVYGLMLRILSNWEYIDEFWDLTNLMFDEECDLDVKTYVAVAKKLNSYNMRSDAKKWTAFVTRRSRKSDTHATVEGVVEVILGSDWNDNVEKELGDFYFILSENAVLGILWNLWQYPFKALRFFRWVRDCTGYKHNAVTYNAILRILGQKESIKEFWGMVKEMKREGHYLDIVTYIKISRYLCKMKMLRDAVEVYELMMDGSYKPPNQDCTSLLWDISKSENPDLELVFRVVKKYEAAGNPLSRTVYEGIHRSLTSVGKFDEAEKTREAMVNAGYEPNSETYSNMVAGLCKAGNLEEAVKMLDEMEAKGCFPDRKAWTCVIRGHCAAGQIEQASKFFNRMLEKNFEADAGLVEVLVNSLCSKERVDSAYALIIELVLKADLRPLQLTYENLIQKLLRERKNEEAMDICLLMRKHGFPTF